MTSALRATSAGGPSAMCCPKLRTVIVSLTDITRFMSCSISSSVVPCSRMRAQQRDQRVGFGRVHPGGRLVEQQQARFTRQRAGDLDPALVAVGQAARRCPAAASSPTKRSSACARSRVSRSSRAVAPPGSSAPMKAGARAHVAADHDVLDHAQLAEQPDVLKRPGDAAAGDRVGRAAGDLGAVEADRPAVGPVQPRDDVEGGRLARAVGTDEGVDVAAAHRHVEPVDGGDAAEALDEPAHVEQTALRAATLSGAFTRAVAGTVGAHRRARGPAACAARRERAAREQPDESLRHEDDHRDDRRAVDHDVRALERAQHLGQAS